jgi:hypothetical protein
MHESRALRPNPPLQITTFELDDDRYTNTIDLYDIAPRFVFYKDQKDGTFLKSLRREFEHGGVTYQLLLRPGRVVRPDGEEEAYPGEREQIIEAVIFRLATERGRLVVQDERVRLSFTLYEIREELRKVRHLFNVAEIKEALTILHTSIVEISTGGRKSANLLSASSFPVLALRSREDDERAYLQFNPLVEKAIRHLHFRRMNYERLMRIANPVSRWLFRRLCQSAANLNESLPPTLVMTATDIARYGGLTARSLLRDTLGNAAKAVSALVDEGIIEPLVPEPHLKGRLKVDLTFEMVPTQALWGEIRCADRLEADAREHLRVVARTDLPERFIPVDRSISSRVRSARKQLELLT